MSDDSVLHELYNAIDIQDSKSKESEEIKKMKEEAEKNQKIMKKKMKKNNKIQEQPKAVLWAEPTFKDWIIKNGSQFNQDVEFDE